MHLKCLCERLVLASRPFLDTCQEQFPGASDSWLANDSFLELQQGAPPGMRLGDKRGVNARLVMSDDSKYWTVNKHRPNKNRIGWIGYTSNKRIDQLPGPHVD